MKDNMPNLAEKYSRADSEVQELAERTPSGAELAAKISGTSSETAAIFGRKLTIPLIDPRPLALGGGSGNG